MSLRDFFYLHRSDRQVIAAFLVLAAVVAAALCLTTGRGEPPLGRSPSGSDTLRSGKHAPYHAQPAQAPERFAFDPNTADSTQLLRLGLQPWQVRNIYRYRAAGGIYSRKEDFARLYGLTVKEYRELEPYIVIGPDYRPAATLFADRPTARDSHRHPASGQQTGSGEAADSTAKATARRHKIAPGEHVDLNAADTAVYQRVPGVGSYYARRIAYYGRRLGGYVSVDQIDEIGDVPPEVKAYFAVETDSVRRMDVNALSLAELRRHPYINYYQARAITDYRRLHGPLASLDDLRLLDDFTPEDIARIAPYVVFEAENSR